MKFLNTLAMVTTTITTLASALEVHQAGGSGASHRRRHAEVAHRPRDNVTIHERGGWDYPNARLTYYAAGLGACGNHNTASDFIVALNSPMFGSGYPGPNCGRSLTINCNGRVAHATVEDECPGCPGNGGLDLTEGLFKALGNLGQGVLTCDWSWGSGGGGDNAPPPPKPKPTHHTTHTTHTTHTHPTSTREHTTTKPTTTSHHTTSTKDDPTTTSHSKSHTTSTKESSSDTSSDKPSTTSSALPTPTDGPTSEFNIVAVNALLVQFANLITFGSA